MFRLDPTYIPPQLPNVQYTEDIVHENYTYDSPGTCVYETVA